MFLNVIIWYVILIKMSDFEWNLFVLLINLDFFSEVLMHERLIKIHSISFMYLLQIVNLFSQFGLLGV